MKALFIILIFTITSTVFADNDKIIKDTISKMTIKEKIGQLFNIAIVGKTLKPHYKEFIEEYQIGGITLFNYNIKSQKQLKGFITELQNISKVPMFISIDQEGGRITRYKKGKFSPPSPYLLGKLNDVNIVKKVGEYTARDLNEIGINLNIAPVADILTTNKNHAIYDRSFGKTSDIVSKMVVAYIEGLQENGVIAVIKHFPGQGSIKQDTHKTLPITRIKKELLFKRDLKPFKTAIDKGVVNVVMSSHVIFANIDHKYPATLSKKLLKNVLRTKLNYNGIVFTDGLEMMAILKTYGLEKATLLALQGEVDVVTINWDLKNVKRAINYIEKSVKDKTLSEDIINEKLFRIFKVKNKYLTKESLIKKKVSKKKMENFLKNIYKKGARFQNAKLEDLTNKEVYSNIKAFKKSKTVKYSKKLAKNIENSVIIVSKLTNINKSLFKNNIIVFLGADIGVKNKKHFKGLILNENNKYTRAYITSLVK